MAILEISKRHRSTSIALQSHRQQILTDPAFATPSPLPFPSPAFLKHQLPPFIAHHARDCEALDLTYDPLRRLFRTPTLHASFPYTLSDLTMSDSTCFLRSIRLSAHPHDSRDAVSPVLTQMHRHLRLPPATSLLRRLRPLAVRRIRPFTFSSVLQPIRSAHCCTAHTSGLVHSASTPPINRLSLAATSRVSPHLLLQPSFALGRCRRTLTRYEALRLTQEAVLLVVDFRCRPEGILTALLRLPLRSPVLRRSTVPVGLLHRHDEQFMPLRAEMLGSRLGRSRGDLASLVLASACDGRGPTQPRRSSLAC
ncbi:hypothetical protein AAT19DRAFT_11537 [Rhodotorula toruloides]|uniref:Uncharacterized protein n=1 Tax=Rhodotorula toruloides TaxID=5286 RepID=A0A2S9ZVW1_RHOTO|nr:hypothetical protein AAT19DRAFT_11537 [Rhodotorula toruloides]